MIFHSTFTCNMHAFGMSHQLCVEFLKKQCIISNLTAGMFFDDTNRNPLSMAKSLFFLSLEQQKMLFDNVQRMYKETAQWRS